MKRTASALAVALSCLFFAAASGDEKLTADEQKTLRQLESDIGPLKEEVHQTKARMRDLKEAVLRGKITGSKAYILFENNAEGFFVLRSVEFFLDGDLFKRVEIPEGKKTVEKLVVFDDDIPSGDHRIKVKANYQGSDKSIYRMFTYFKDHLFSVEGTETFPVEYGKTTLVKLTALDKGYFKTKLEERLFLEMKISRDWGTETAQDY